MMLYSSCTPSKDKSRASSDTAYKELKVSSKAEKVVSSYKENDEVGIAKNYEELAKTLLEKEDHLKAEEYLKKALISYEKLKLKDDIARVSRALAKVKEKQLKTNEAITYYNTASNSVSNESTRKINQSDASRLNFKSDKEAQENCVSSNISILKKHANSTDLQDAYLQKAELDIEQKKFDEAIQTYYQAITAASNNSEQIRKLNSKIAAVYVMNKEYDKAIAMHLALLEEARRLKKTEEQIKQFHYLSEIYFSLHQIDKAIFSLKSAYNLALEKSHTKEVKESLSRLLNYYKKVGNDKESIALYDTFFQNFDDLIHSDSSLIDINTFQVIEGKIEQLEKEKKLKDKLIYKTNTFNYFLISSLVVLLILIALFIRALLSIKTKNKKIALQSLRREMNPHFIFNSLNSVNQFISQNKELEANKYLISYSNLMRNIMENSSKDFIVLGKEIELLKKYLDLELMRFEDKFDFTIFVDEKLDQETILVPNMLIQPNLENAIWHGLRYLDGKGLLALRFSLEKEMIVVTIDDNGIGMAKSAELKTQNQKVHESLGLKNTKERISLLNDLYNKSISLEIIEKSAPEQGTIIKLVFPLIDKPL